MLYDIKASKCATHFAHTVQMYYYADNLYSKLYVCWDKPRRQDINARAQDKEICLMVSFLDKGTLSQEPDSEVSPLLIVTKPSSPRIHFHEFIECDTAQHRDQPHTASCSSWATRPGGITLTASLTHTAILWSKHPIQIWAGLNWEKPFKLNGLKFALIPERTNRQKQSCLGSMEAHAPPAPPTAALRHSAPRPSLPPRGGSPRVKPGACFLPPLRVPVGMVRTASELHRGKLSFN